MKNDKLIELPQGIDETDQNLSQHMRQNFD